MKKKNKKEEKKKAGKEEKDIREPKKKSTSSMSSFTHEDVLQWSTQIISIFTDSKLPGLKYLLKVMNFERIYDQLAYNENPDSYQKFMEGIEDSLGKELSQAKSIDDLSPRAFFWAYMIRAMRERKYLSSFLPTKKKGKKEKNSSAGKIAEQIMQLFFVYVINELSIRFLLSRTTGTIAEKHIQQPLEKFISLSEKIGHEMEKILKHFSVFEELKKKIEEIPVD